MQYLYPSFRSPRNLYSNFTCKIKTRDSTDFSKMLSDSSQYEIEYPFKLCYFRGKCYDMQCLTIRPDSVVLNQNEMNSNAVILDSQYIGIHVNPTDLATVEYLQMFKESSYNEPIEIGSASYDLSNFIIMLKMREIRDSKNELFIKMHYNTLETPCSKYFGICKLFSELFPFGTLPRLVQYHDTEEADIDIGEQFIKLGNQLKSKGIRKDSKLKDLVLNVKEMMD